MLIKYLLVFLTSFVLMEFIANFTHQYVMHGFMWYFHEDHHKRTPGFFEKNDIFFVIFAIPSILLINIGIFMGYYLLISIGLGIMAYGLAYFIVHEVLIHRRLKFMDRFDNAYFRALIKAHQDHHSRITKTGCSNFGMLYVASSYFKNVQ